jgi:hypothetical protein
MLFYFIDLLSQTKRQSMGKVFGLGSIFSVAHFFFLSKMTNVLAFNTLERERAAIQPNKKKTHVPGLHELIKPHLESFNAIKETTGSTGQKGKGLLDLAVADMDHRDIKDSFGNKIECMDFEAKWQ